jgi:hypothetical protein
MIGTALAWDLEKLKCIKNLGQIASSAWNPA